MKYNPGSVVKFTPQPRNSERDPVTFSSIFVCFQALKNCFLRGCRPFIGLDGAHLKGEFGGVILSAVTMDGNNAVIPLAWAVVQSECKESWNFFLDCLHQCIGAETAATGLTFMSDR